MPLPTATCLTHALSDALLISHPKTNFTLAQSRRPPQDASHLLAAHQEADRLASVGAGCRVDVGAGRGRAGRAVAGQAGEVVLGAVVVGQVLEVLQPALDTQLEREQRLELQPLDGAQQDHGVWRTADRRMRQKNMSRIRLLIAFGKKKKRFHQVKFSHSTRLGTFPHPSTRPAPASSADRSVAFPAAPDRMTSE